MDSNVTACVVSYHNGRHTLTLLIDNKLHIMGISSEVLGALSRAGVEALVKENRETRYENRTHKDRLWLNGAVAAIDPLCGGLGASATASEVWRKHIGDIRPEPEHLKSK
jgi:hypothetical protein